MEIRMGNELFKKQGLEAFVSGHNNGIKKECLDKITSFNELLECCDLFDPDSDPTEWSAFQIKARLMIRDYLDSEDGHSMQEIKTVFEKIKKSGSNALAMYFIQTAKAILQKSSPKFNNKPVNVLA